MNPAFYDIHHTLSLSAHQRRILALGITRLHNTAFTSSAFSVHVKFTCGLIYSPLHSADYFVGGKEFRSCNRIFIYVHRGGLENTRRSVQNEEETNNRLVRSIKFLWESYVCRGKSVDFLEAKLHAIVVIPGLINSGEDLECRREQSESQTNCLAIGLEVRAPDVWSSSEDPESESSDSTSESSLSTWSNQRYYSSGTTTHSNCHIKTDNEENPRTRTRLSRKAKFYRLK